MVKLRCRAKDPCETHDQPPRSGGAQVVTQQKSPEPIHIGAIYNLTGSQAPLSGPSLDGARLAVDRINAAGGLLGRRVELLERDPQANPALVRYDAQNLAALKVTAIIGLSDTDQVLAAAPVAARAAIPFITSGATSPLLPAQVPDWLFLACFGDNVQAAAGAEYAADWLGARTAAILSTRTWTTRAGCNATSGNASAPKAARWSFAPVSAPGNTTSPSCWRRPAARAAARVTAARAPCP